MTGLLRAGRGFTDEGSRVASDTADEDRRVVCERAGEGRGRS